MGTSSAVAVWSQTPVYHNPTRLSIFSYAIVKERSKVMIAYGVGVQQAGRELALAIDSRTNLVTLGDGSAAAPRETEVTGGEVEGQITGQEVKLSLEAQSDLVTLDDDSSAVPQVAYGVGVQQAEGEIALAIDPRTNLTTLGDESAMLPQELQQPSVVGQEAASGDSQSLIAEDIQTILVLDFRVLNRLRRI